MPHMAAADSLSEHFNPILPEQLRDPYPLYARARREEPVFYSRQLDVWIITRYADILAILRDTDRFSSFNSLYAQAAPIPEVREVLREEAVCNAIDLLAAGHETTTNLIGNGVDLLLRYPEVARTLREDSGLIAPAIDEMLRYESPVHGFYRGVTADVEVAGTRIPKGARLFLLYASGNRDEAEFEGGERFDIRREDAGKHLAFGKGVHFCVGSLLGRTEARVAIEQLLERLPGLRRGEGEARRREFFLVRGFESFPIAWDAAPGAN